jgi:hypothetical protein
MDRRIASRAIGHAQVKRTGLITRENIDALHRNITVPESLLLSVISSCQGGTHQMLDDMCVDGQSAALLQSHGS